MGLIETLKERGIHQTLALNSSIDLNMNYLQLEAGKGETTGGQTPQQWGKLLSFSSLKMEHSY